MTIGVSCSIRGNGTISVDLCELSKLLFAIRPIGCMAIYLFIENSPTVWWGCFIGCGTRIRTATNRFRDCRATFTQFRNVTR